MTRSASPVDRQVGVKLRVRRLSVGMSQTTLARALDVTFQQVQKYEKGTSRISAGRLQRIAETLGVPVADLFDFSDAAHPVTDEAAQLLTAFYTVADAAVRRRILALVREIASPAGKLGEG